MKRYLHAWSCNPRVVAHAKVDMQQFPKMRTVISGAVRGRRVKLPCCLEECGKFRHGAKRNFCLVHQRHHGKKSDDEKNCDLKDELMDYDAEPFQLRRSDGAEIVIWSRCPPSIDTYTPHLSYYPMVHVLLRKEDEEEKVIDKNFPCIEYFAETKSNPDSLIITPNNAFAYLNAKEKEIPMEVVTCKKCGGLHDDINLPFAETAHVKHLCEHCGRDVWNPQKRMNVGNSLMKINIKTEKKQVDNEPLHLQSDRDTFQIWPSTPAVLWTRDGPEVLGIHVHVWDKDGKRVTDETFGEVYLDKEKLDRSKLFADMLEAALDTSDCEEGTGKKRKWQAIVDD